MTGSIPPAGPLSYEGQVVVPFIMRNFAPTTSNNQFPVPTIWIDPLDMTAYMLVSKALGIADWISLGSAAGGLETITTPDSVMVTPTAGNIDFLNGTGMNITGSGSNITFNATGGALTWNFVTATSEPAVADNGYIADNAAGVGFSLPATCPFGEFIWIGTVDAGGWTLSQNAGQQIQLGEKSTTIGVTGSLSSTKIGDSVLLVCTVADTNFLALAFVGDITYV